MKVQGPRPTEEKGSTKVNTSFSAMPKWLLTLSKIICLIYLYKLLTHVQILTEKIKVSFSNLPDYSVS